jgi:hypothetical protein
MSGSGFQLGLAISSYEWMAAYPYHWLCFYACISEEQDIYNATVSSPAL